MMRASSGAVGELSARSPLLLDDPECGWRVAAGRVDLFAVELVEGEPRGRRHALGTVLPGGALFGLRADAAELALLAVGPTGTRLERLDERRPDAREHAGLIEGWAELLAGASRQTITERAGVLLRAGRPADGGGGRAGGFAARGRLDRGRHGSRVERRRACWGASARPGPCDRCAARISRSGRSKVMRWSTTGAGPRVGSRGARRRPCSPAWAARSRRRARASAPRSKRRKDTEQEEIERVYTSLARVVEHRGEAMAAPGEDPVVAACRIAGEPLGIEVTEPPRLHGESVAVRLREVARSSAFRIREVALDDGWWRHDVGPLVGVVLRRATGRSRSCDGAVATSSLIRLAAPARRSTAGWRRRWLRSLTCRTRVWDARRPTVAG